MAQKPTLDKLIQDLELVKQMAIDDRHITGAISAIVTQAKLLGLDKGDTLTIKHNEPPVFNIQPVRPVTQWERDEFREIAKEVLAKV